MIRSVAALALLLLTCTTVAHAQCLDGTPPPCLEPASRAVVMPVNRAAPVPDPARRARLVGLLPFRNVTRQPAQDWLVDGAPLMLGTALAQFRDLTVSPLERQSAALTRQKTSETSLDAAALRRLAQATGAWTFVSGQLFVTGNVLRIEVTVTDAATGRVQARNEATVATDADVRPAFDRLARQLMEGIGVLPSGAAELGTLTTTSLDAYRAYAEGMSASMRGELPAALEKFRTAVKADSTFAMAWLRLGGLLSFDPAAYFSPESDAHRAWNTAARLSARLSPAEQAEVRINTAWLSGQLGLARELADSLWRVDSTDSQATAMYSAMQWSDVVLKDSLRPELGTRGDRNEALRLLSRIVRRDPTDARGYSALAGNWLFIAGNEGAPPSVGVFPSERASITAMADQRAPRRLVLVASDTLEWMTLEAWRALPRAEQLAYRRRAAERLRDWTLRWTQLQPDSPEGWEMLAAAYVRLQDYPAAVTAATRVRSMGAITAYTRSSAAQYQSIAELGAGRYADALRTSTDAVRDTAILGDFRAFIGRQRVASLLALGRWDDAWRALGETAPLFRRTADCATLSSFLVETIGWPLPFSARRHIADTVARSLPDVLARPGIAKCAVQIARGLTNDSLTLRRTEASEQLQRQLTAQLAAPAGVGDGLILSLSQALVSIDSTAVAALRGNPRFATLERETTLPALVDADSVIVSGDSIQVTWRWRGATNFRWDVPDRFAAWSLGVVVPIGSTRVTLQVARAVPPDTLVEKTGRFAELVPHATFVGAASPVPVAALGAAAARTREWRGTARADGDRLVLVVRGPLADAMRTTQALRAEFSTARCYGLTGGLCDRPSRPIVYR